MTAGRPAHRCRRAVLAAVLVLLSAVGGAAARAAVSEPPPSPAALTLTGLEPRAPTAADEVVLRGEVRNDGETVLRSLRVRLRVSREAVTSRSELAAQAGSTAPFGGLVSGADAASNLPDLPAGGRVTFTVRTAGSALQLPGLGVYPFGVDLRGDAGDGMETLNRLRTWLPFGAAPKPPPGVTAPARSSTVKPTTIAWLWPLVDLPDRRADGSFPNDELAASIRPTGRLGRLLTAAKISRPPSAGTSTASSPGMPLTVAVDPALLEALSAMADGYVVRPAEGKAVPGTGRAAATAFLAQLRQVTAATPVLTLPYADPDLDALVRAGRANDVSVATSSATFRQLVHGVLGTAPLEHIAWPPDGFASQPTIDALTGVDTVVLSGSALPVLPSLSYTPDAASTLPAVAGGTLRALASDPTLDALVAADPLRTGGVRLAEQRFLAETLLITAEQPSLSRSMVIAPPRRWAPPASWAAALLRDSSSVPWLRPARLADLQPRSGDRERGLLTYPAAAEQAELPASVFTGRNGVRLTAATLETFKAILTNPEAAGIAALERALLRSESSAWRASPDAGRAMRESTRETLDGLVAKVRITTEGTVSLASKKSTIPISVANGLGQSVRIQVEINSTGAQLIAEDTGVKVVTGGHQIQLSVGLQAPGSGVFPITAALLTPDGETYGEPVRLRVYSSRYGKLALAITAGAFAVLVLIATIRIGRRLRAAGRPAEGR